MGIFSFIFSNFVNTKITIGGLILSAALKADNVNSFRRIGRRREKHSDEDA